MMRRNWNTGTLPGMGRRTALAALAVLPVALSAVARAEATRGSARLAVEPFAGTWSLAPGLRRVSVGGIKLKIYVPASAASLERVPLMMLLHGAMGAVDPLLYAHRAVADATGVCIVAPYSGRKTWDALNTGFGPDIEGLGQALTWMFEHAPIDPARMALAGFSDGASYALAVGRANGDLFRTVIAYSPGGLLPVAPIGSPHLVITHGRTDPVLPFRNTSEVIVPWLQANGYDVQFDAFDGGHVVPRQALEREVRMLGAQ